MTNFFHDIGETFKRSMEDYFVAPEAYASKLEFSSEQFTIESHPGRHRGDKIIISAIGLFFLIIPLLGVVVTGEFPWPMLCFVGGGLLALLVVFAPGRWERLQVTRAGIHKEQRWRQRQSSEFYSAEQVREVRFVRTTRGAGAESSKGVTQWGVGVALDSGKIVGILLDLDRERARTTAELVHRLLQEGKGSPLPLVDRSVTSGPRPDRP